MLSRLIRSETEEQAGAIQKHITQIGIVVLAVLGVLIGLHFYQKKTVEGHVKAGFLEHGLASANPVKRDVIQYYEEYGKMPSSNDELGLPEPADLSGRSLRGIEVTEGGQLILTFSYELGVDQGRIYLTPSLANPTMNSWSCTTPSYPKIEKLIPECEFRERG
ncbi:MAG: pilin [Acidobacteriota bacterium]|nr:pilin [Acidobacteriota bacterium]